VNQRRLLASLLNVDAHVTTAEGVEALTQREMQILSLVAEGQSTGEMANKLFLS